MSVSPADRFDRDCAQEERPQQNLTQRQAVQKAAGDLREKEQEGRVGDVHGRQGASAALLQDNGQGRVLPEHRAEKDQEQPAADKQKLAAFGRTQMQAMRFGHGGSLEFKVQSSRFKVCGIGG